MGKRRKNTTWPQTAKMTDVEVKCHGMEANMAVRIVYKVDLKGQHLTALSIREKGTFPNECWQLSHYQTLSSDTCGSLQRPK